MLHATPPDYSRIFCSICWFFCVFDKRQRARYQIGKKISVKHQQFKDLVICFSCEFFIELAGSTFVTIIFATNFMIFFSTGGVLVV